MKPSTNGLHLPRGGAGRCRFCGEPTLTIAGMPQVCTSDECGDIAAREGEERALTSPCPGVPSMETPNRGVHA